MKSTLLRIFFEWALIASVLMSVGFFAWFFGKSRQLRSCSAQMADAQSRFQNNRALMGMLVAECQEYAKTNADLARLLNPAAAQMPAAPMSTPAPAPKPKAK
jgi:hypothetical protein